MIYDSARRSIGFYRHVQLLEKVSGGALTYSLKIEMFIFDIWPFFFGDQGVGHEDAQLLSGFNHVRIYDGCNINGGFHKWGYPKWMVYTGKSY